MREGIQVCGCGLRHSSNCYLSERTVEVPIVWFDAAQGDQRVDTAHGVVENPETGELTIIEAVLFRPQFPDTPHWIVDGTSRGDCPRLRSVTVTKSCFDSLLRRGKISESGVLKDLARTLGPAAPLPRWA